MYTAGNSFPDVSMLAVDENNEIINIDVLSNEWTVVYFYPKDFTFICPTEIAAMDILLEEADVIGVSGDNEHCKLAWKTVNGQIREIKHLLAADCGLYLSNELGIVDDSNGVPFRATFIIDPHNIIQHVSVNNLNVGRNPAETLRILDALQTDELCPCNRPVGGDTI